MPATRATPRFESAREALEGGDEHGTVARSYAASYARLQDHLRSDETRTPRELLAAAEGRVEGSIHAALATMTDAYEQTVFAGKRPIETEEVVESAHIFVGMPAPLSPPTTDR